MGKEQETEEEPRDTIKDKLDKIKELGDGQEKIEEIYKMNDFITDGFNLMKKFRGDVIEKGLQIDLVLEEIIANYFINSDRIKNEQFKKLMLNSRDTTTFRKIQFFRELGLYKNPKFENKYDDVVTRLFWFINTRNDFAHLPRKSYNHEFKFRWKSDKKYDYRNLDDDFLKEIEDEFQYLVNALIQIQFNLDLMINWAKAKELEGLE